MGLLEDALELVVWFENQPDCSSYKKDAEIAVDLGWFVRSMPLGVPRRDRGNFGEAARVRRAKRKVDKDGRDGDCLFAGYSFGTKRNGSGVRYTMLHTPKSKHHPDALNEATSEQFGRANQAAEQHKAEVARMTYRLQELEEVYIQAHQTDRAFCVHDAINDLRTFGSIRLDTLKDARRLGIFQRLTGDE